MVYMYFGTGSPLLVHTVIFSAAPQVNLSQLTRATLIYTYAYAYLHIFSVAKCCWSPGTVGLQEGDHCMVQGLCSHAEQCQMLLTGHEHAHICKQRLMFSGMSRSTD